MVKGKLRPGRIEPKWVKWSAKSAPFPPHKFRTVSLVESSRGRGNRTRRPSRIYWKILIGGKGVAKNIKGTDDFPLCPAVTIFPPMLYSMTLLPLSGFKIFS
jgi:hypothetical protein